MQAPQPTITYEFLRGFVEIWYLWMPLLLLLILMGWVTRRHWGGKLSLASLVVLALFAARVTLRENAIERRKIAVWNQLRVPLSRTAKIDGLQLAAGTTVRWNQDQAGHLLTAELGDGQEVSPGIVLSGEVSRPVEEYWRGTLVHDSVIRGWKCAAGQIDVYSSGELRWCRLAALHKVLAGEIPAGTAVLFDSTVSGDALLHLGRDGMVASTGNRLIPAGEWLYIDTEGVIH